MAITLDGIPVVSVGDVEVFSIGYSDWLETGELLTGTPTVTEVTTSDLTISNKVVSTTALTILRQSIPASEAVQFTVSGQQASMVYKIRISVSTDATPARTCVRDILFSVEA